jgi:hypothetical protein
LNGIASGRDRQEGMAALLRRSATEKHLIQTCHAEWTKFSAKAPGAEAESELLAAVIEKSAGSSPVETYRAICQALSARQTIRMTGTK